MARKPVESLRLAEPSLSGSGASFQMPTALHAIESFISSIPLFASLDRKYRRRLAEASLVSQAEYPPLTILRNEGGPGDRLFIIVDGEIEVIKGLGTEDERVLRVCGPGEHIGEMSLLDHGRCFTSLRTRSSVRLIELIKDDFETLHFRCPNFAWAVASVMSKRFRELEDRLLREIRETRYKLGTATSMLAELSRFLPPEEQFYLETIREPEQSAPEPQGRLPGRQKDRRNESSVIRTGVPRLYIRTLGDFKVWRGGCPIEEYEWKGNQPKLLLKAIIARLPSVPKYVLIEDLWPEAPPETGEANFKFVLHQLRKTLEPGLPKGCRSSYISLKGGLVTLGKTLCQVDLDKFLSLSGKGRKAEASGDLSRARFFYNAATELYKGDFLPEDLYLPWATVKKREIRKSYIDLLLRTAKIYETEGNSRKAIECHTRIIEIDPLFEESYQRLMLLHSQRGQCAMALRVFEDFKRYLYDQFGTLPDRLTTAIYEKTVSGCHAHAEVGSTCS